MLQNVPIFITFRHSRIVHLVTTLVIIAGPGVPVSTTQVSTALGGPLSVLCEPKQEGAGTVEPVSINECDALHSPKKGIV